MKRNGGDEPVEDEERLHINFRGTGERTMIPKGIQNKDKRVPQRARRAAEVLGNAFVPPPEIQDHAAMAGIEAASNSTPGFSTQSRGTPGSGSLVVNAQSSADVSALLTVRSNDTNDTP